MTRYLLFATELYGLPVLRPLDVAIRAAGGEVAWFAPSTFKPHLKPHVFYRLMREDWRER